MIITVCVLCIWRELPAFGTEASINNNHSFLAQFETFSVIVGFISCSGFRIG